MNSKKPTKTKNEAEAQVEELLKAVEDDMLLNLSLNSHISRVSPDYIDSDLDCRFRALKSRPSNSTHPNPKPSPSSSASSVSDLPPQLPEQTLDPELKAVLGDDLSARFAKLRASLSQSPSASISGDGAKGLVEDLEDEDDEVDEVGKLIRWAKDAARLDPSPPSDDDVDEDEDEHHHPRK